MHSIRKCSPVWSVETLLELELEQQQRQSNSYASQIRKLSTSSKRFLKQPNYHWKAATDDGTANFLCSCCSYPSCLLPSFRSPQTKTTDTSRTLLLEEQETLRCLTAGFREEVEGGRVFNVSIRMAESLVVEHFRIILLLLLICVCFSRRQSFCTNKESPFDGQTERHQNEIHKQNVTPWFLVLVRNFCICDTMSVSSSDGDRGREARQTKGPAGHSIGAERLESRFELQLIGKSTGTKCM